MEKGKYYVFEVVEDKDGEIRGMMQLMDYCKGGFITLKFIEDREEDSKV